MSISACGNLDCEPEIKFEGTVKGRTKIEKFIDFCNKVKRAFKS